MQLQNNVVAILQLQNNETLLYCCKIRKLAFNIHLEYYNFKICIIGIMFMLQLCNDTPLERSLAILKQFQFFFWNHGCNMIQNNVLEYKKLLYLNNFALKQCSSIIWQSQNVVGLKYWLTNIEQCQPDNQSFPQQFTQTIMPIWHSLISYTKMP